MSAVNLGAEAIMDLSSHGDTQPFRKKLTTDCPAMIGTVPVYDSVIHYQRDLATLTAKAIRDSRLPEDDHSEACSMCGKFCAVRSMNKALAGEYIDIL